MTRQTPQVHVATLAAVSVVGVGAVSVIGWKMMHRKSDPKSTHNLLNGGDADAKLEADEEEEEADTSLDSASGNSPSSPASISRRIKIEDPETVSRRLAIRNMALDAWTAHCNYAWGQDLLLPNKQEAFNFHFGPSSGHTLITALSTLWILDLKDEFTRASRWVENRFELSRIKQQWDVKDTVEDYIGSFLSCYALSGESMFLERAKEVALAIDGAYATKTGIPYPSINPQNGKSKYQPTTSLSDASTGFLEYPLLSELTGNSSFRRRITKIRSFLHLLVTSAPGSLPLQTFNVESGEWTVDNPNDTTNPKPSTTARLDHSTRNFPIGLYKRYLQSGCTDSEAIRLYATVLDALEGASLFTVSRTGQLYARSYNVTAKCHSDYSVYTGAYLGAMLSLGSKALENCLKIEMEIQSKNGKNSLPNEEQLEVERDRIYRHRKLARELTETFAQASAKTLTGLPPFRMYFNQTDEATNSGDEHCGFNLGPELAESYFILWRLTHDPKYRDYAWTLAQSMEAHCHVQTGGYSELESTSWLPTEKVYPQPARFLGATLKYLYLTFTDDSVYPLEEWVFNNAGQPLPVRGTYKVKKSLCSIS